ncbi:hypothetical protein CK203_082164 [Vitis vinifera]|uniref:Uncharacterized protein n=1 Tax=Vitis vinifera TaxID=29760 RepID=A0A438CNB6_VITVI|nr:hypothetical protein CK203_082164 [Vitis vinifera]
MNEERLMHKPPFVSDADWKWFVHFLSSEKAWGQLREDGIQPNRIEMFKLTHTCKNGTPVDQPSHEIMVNN